MVKRRLHRLGHRQRSRRAPGGAVLTRNWIYGSFARRPSTISLYRLRRALRTLLQLDFQMIHMLNESHDLWIHGDTPRNTVLIYTSPHFPSSLKRIGHVYLTRMKPNSYSRSVPHARRTFGVTMFSPRTLTAFITSVCPFTNNLNIPTLDFRARSVHIVPAKNRTLHFGKPNTTTCGNSKLRTREVPATIQQG